MYLFVCVYIFVHSSPLLSPGGPDPAVRALHDLMGALVHPWAWHHHQGHGRGGKPLCAGCPSPSRRTRPDHHPADQPWGGENHTGPCSSSLQLFIFSSDGLAAFQVLNVCTFLAAPLGLRFSSAEMRRSPTSGCLWVPTFISGSLAGAVLSIPRGGHTYVRHRRQELPRERGKLQDDTLGDPQRSRNKLHKPENHTQTLSRLFFFFFNLFFKSPIEIQ